MSQEGLIGLSSVYPTVVTGSHSSSDVASGWRPQGQHQSYSPTPARPLSTLPVSARGCTNERILISLPAPCPVPRPPQSPSHPVCLRLFQTSGSGKAAPGAGGWAFCCQPRLLEPLHCTSGGSLHVKPESHCVEGHVCTRPTRSWTKPMLLPNPTLSWL